MIAKLSNQDLDASLKRLVASERKILHVILEHINEVASRKLYLEMAYSSLYEYLVKECQYSGSAAMRRISAAQLLSEIPVVAEKILSGDLNLSQIGELVRAIKEKEKSGVQVSALQKTELVSVISGKTTFETQKEISVGLDMEIKIPEKTFVQKDESVRAELTLSKNQHLKIVKCKDLAGHALLAEFKDTSLASLFEFLVDYYLENEGVGASQNDQTSAVKLKVVRSAEEDEEGQNVSELPKSESVVAEVFASPVTKTNKTLTPKARQAILQRDKCCQFKDPKSGKLCGNTFGLEVDHKTPRWAAGDHSFENLQALCRAHNNFKYQRESNTRFL